MANGELTVSIIGDMSKLSKVFSQASSEVGKFGNSVTNLGSSMTSKVGSALSTVGTAAVVAGSALGVGLVAGGAKATGMFVDFEKSVSNAASVTGLAGDAFAAAKENISAVAQELGQKTAFSSSQAADALYNLASAGVDVSQITSSQLVPVLNLASGTQYDLAATTSAVTSTLSQFGLGFESAGRVADVFAKDAGLTQASMDKLSLSMNYVGTIANTCGISLETTSASLGVLYNAGMDGSTAGTSLRGVLASLVAPTDKAAGVLHTMGLTVDDVSPVTNDFTDIVQKLADKGLNATQAFDIFGRESAPAILALTSKSGDLKTLTSELENAGGAAQTMADQQLDTLSGSLDSLSGSIENLWINAGQALAPTVRQVVDTFNAMIPAIQEFVVGVVETFVSFVSQLGQSADAVMAIGSTIFDVLMNVFESIAGSGAGIANSAADVINGIMGRIAGIVIEIAPIIQGSIIGVIEFIRNLVTGLQPTWVSLSSIATRLITLFKELFSGISGPDSKSAASAITNVVNTISAVLARLTVVATTALIKIIPSIRSTFTSIINTVEGFIPTLQNIFNSVSTAISDIDIAAVISSIKSTLQSIDFAGIFNSVISTLKSINFSGIFDTLKSAFDAGKTLITGFVIALAPSWDNLKSSLDSIKTILEEVAPSFVSFFGTLGGGGASSAVSITSVLAGVINTLSGAIASLLKWMADNPNVVKFGLALTGVAIAASGLIVGLAGIISVLTPIFATISAGIAFVSGLSLSWASLGTVVSVLGTTLFPGLSAAIGTVASVALPILTAAFGALSTSIGIIVYTVVPILVEALGLLISPIGLIIAGIGLLYVAWTRDWGNIREVTTNVINSLNTNWTKLTTEIGRLPGVVSSSLSTLAGIFSASFNTIKITIASFISGIISAIGTLYNGLLEKYNQIKNGNTSFQTSWSTFWNSVNTILGTAGSQVNTKLGALYNYINSKYTQIKSGNTAFNSAWTSFWNTVNSTLGSASSALNSKLVALYNYINSKYTQIKSADTSFHSAWNTFWSNVNSVLNSASSTLNSKLGSLYSALNSKYTQIKSADTSLHSSWNTFWNTMISTAQNAGSKLISAISGIPGDIRALASSFSKAGDVILDALYDSIVSGFNKVIKKAKSLLSDLKDLMPNSPAKEGPFKTLPNWDTAMYDPLNASIGKIQGLSFPLSNALSNIRSPLDTSTAAGLQNVSNVTTSSTVVEGSKYSIGPVYVRNDNDMQVLIAAVKSSIANDRRKAGII